MIACIEAIDDAARGHIVQLYAYTVEETADAPHRGDGVKDANHALQIVDALCRRAEDLQPGDAVILKGEPPRSPGHAPLWVIQIQVSNTHRGISSYRADYHKFPGCPNEVAEYMMEIFGTVKHVLKRARKDLAARKAERKAAVLESEANLKLANQFHRADECGRIGQ